MTTTSTSIDLSSLPARAASGERLTVKHLAREYKVKAPELKRIIVAVYGARVQFKRGRTGGIVFTK